eukprot:1814894-Amphidinium_carterae.1
MFVRPGAGNVKIMSANILIGSPRGHQWIPHPEFYETQTDGFGRHIPLYFPWSSLNGSQHSKDGT